MNSNARRRRAIRLERLQGIANDIDGAEAALDRALATRERELIRCHGDRRTGGLSYDELARATRISKGRVIQIVQGRSKYSKRQTEERQARDG